MFCRALHEREPSIGAAQRPRAKRASIRTTDNELANELTLMAETDLAAQAPIAALVASDPRFAEWVERVVVARGEPLTVARWEDDDPPVELVAIRALADDHDARLASIIAECGWPGRSLVGEDAADAAWLLAQHADRHQATRRSWLAALEKAAACGEADPRHLARLTDRVAMLDGRPQSYGTYSSLRDDEIVWDVPVEGSLEDVDERRATLGLPPLQDDLRESPNAGPYRHLRTTRAYRWPAR